MSPSDKEHTLGSRNGELGARTLARTEGSGRLSYTMRSQPSTKVSGRQRARSEGQESRNETDSMSDRPGVRSTAQLLIVWPLTSHQSGYLSFLSASLGGHLVTGKQTEKKNQEHGVSLLRLF